MMKNFYSFCFILLACLAEVPAIDFTDNLLITAKMDGSQEVPAVVSNAQGVASLLLNSSRDSICVNVTVTGLSGPITGAHIHKGDIGVSGGVVISLVQFISGNRITGTLSGADVSDNISNLLRGKYYINVHTAAHPSGEIRGQLTLETDYFFPLMPDGNQEVPPVATNAYGLGYLSLSRDLSEIRYSLIFQDLSGAATGADLHYGQPGSTGSIAIALTGNMDGKLLSGIIASPSQSLIDSLMGSNIYINVHTDSNPNGEIRSQLMMENYLHFKAMLDGNQEVPPVMSSARGSAVIMLNTNFDTLWYNITAEGLTGPAMSAHFHNAMFGISGPPVIDLSSSINGNRIVGIISGTELTTDLINKFLRGEMYVNIHTAQFPAGEIRGQVYRSARQGFTFSLNGEQEIPPVSTTAAGSGIVSIGRENEDAHFMFVVDGISPTGAHFHVGRAGEEGNVIFNLTPFLINNIATGFWKKTDTVPFTPSVANQFQKDSIYANVHTSANPAGEIRGQALNGYNCYLASSGIEAADEKTGHFIYPNPTTDFITVGLDIYTTGYAHFHIFNILGKEVFSEEVKVNKGKNSKSIDVAQLPSGIYFLVINSSGRQLMQKFIKSKT